MRGYRLPRAAVMHGVIILGAGVIAGTVATLVQVVLWLLFTADFPGVLFRDARLTAALVLGARVLPPPATFDMAVWGVATVIHFALSIAYAAVIGPFCVRLEPARALAAGAVFGVALYVINLYGLTEIFPWFARARGWNAAVAHVAFGMTAVAAYRWLSFRYGVSRAGGR